MQEMIRDHKAKTIELKMWKEASDNKFKQKLEIKGLEFEDLRSYNAKLWTVLGERDARIIELKESLQRETIDKENYIMRLHMKSDEYDDLEKRFNRKCDELAKHLEVIEQMKAEARQQDDKIIRLNSRVTELLGNMQDLKDFLIEKENEKKQF